ncbi:MAG: ankyrin repeat domain-containing protein [Deltaproteobacteria bacterium]|nr:ankyrin repeat domain-containing protein [Deltaproteobacteria bacterium]
MKILVCFLILALHNSLALGAKAKTPDSRNTIPLYCGQYTNKNKSLVIRAVNKGEWDKVAEFVRSGCSDVSKDQLLIWASEYGPTDAVKFFIETGVDVNRPDSQGRTALLRAVLRGRVDNVKFLVEIGKADVNQADHMLNTPLLRAVQSCHINIIKFLIKNGADVNHTNRNGISPLGFALQHNRTNIVELLIENGAKTNQTDEYEGPLFQPPAKKQIDVVNFPVETEADVNQADLADDDEDKVDADQPDLADNDEDKVDADQTDENSLLPLRRAAYKGNMDVAKYLIEEGLADVDLTDISGLTLLQRAANEGRLDIIKFLVEEKGVAVNPTDYFESDYFSQIPICLAAKNGHKNIVELLVRKGADVAPAKHDIWGMTALDWATANKHPDIVTFLSQSCSFWK